MKKYLLPLLLAFGMAAISCTKEELETKADIASVPAAGGTVTVTVTANGAWTVSCNTSGVSFDKSSGNGSGTIVAAIGENPTQSVRTIDILVSGTSLSQTVTVNQAANVSPTILVGLESGEPDFEGFTLVLEVTSTADWTLTIDNPAGYTAKADVTSGKAGESNVSVVFPENTTSEKQKVTLTFKTSNACGFNTQKVTFSAPAPGMELGGVTYKAVKMKDGRWWMAENLRYVPEGYTPSSDLKNVTAGIYNPVQLNAGKTAVEFTSDEDVIKTNGYLYQSEVALGLKVGDLTTEDAAKALEGAQGICPEGWHIPTATEIINLVGKAVSPYETKTDAPYYDAEKANATIEKLNADGFNADAWGAVSIIDNTKTAATLMGFLKKTPDFISSGYVCGSTYTGKTEKEGAITNFQFLGFMPMAGNGTFNGAKLSYRVGASVRCIKNAK